MMFAHKNTYQLVLFDSQKRRIFALETTISRSAEAAFLHVRHKATQYKINRDNETF